MTVDRADSPKEDWKDGTVGPETQGHSEAVGDSEDATDSGSFMWSPGCTAGHGEPKAGVLVPRVRRIDVGAVVVMEPLRHCDTALHQIWERFGGFEATARDDREEIMAIAVGHVFLGHSAEAALWHSCVEVLGEHDG